MAEINPKKSEALEKIKKILSLTKEKKFKEKEVIFEEGSTDHNFYIVLSGNIEISKKTTSGEPKVIAQIGPGEFLGEGVLSGVIKKPASAKVITDTTLLALPYDEFEKITREEPKTAVDFLITVLKAANSRLNKTNTKLLALFEISQLLHAYRDDLNALSKGLIHKLLSILDSKDGILLLKNPFVETYRVIYSSSEDLNEESLKDFDLQKTQSASSSSGQFLIANLKNLGILAIRRDLDYTQFEADQLRLLTLIAEQVGSAIKEASEGAAEKAKKMLHRKRFEI
jgi:CRP-like cAMP-binding protein